MLNINILESPSSIKIDHKFNFIEKSTLGTFFLFIGGSFLSYLSVHEIHTIQGLIIFLLGSLMLLGSILTFYSMGRNFLAIDEHKIVFKCNSLKSKEFELTNDMNFMTRSYKRTLNSTQTVSSTFRIIEIYLKNKQDEYRVLVYQSNESNSQLVIKTSVGLKNWLNHIKNSIQHSV